MTKKVEKSPFEQLGLTGNEPVEELESLLDLLGLDPEYDEPEKFKNHYLNDENRMQQLQLVLVEKKVVESVLNEAKINEKSLSYDALMEAAQSINN